MKILSWDVGIKNLAFCLMEITDSDSDNRSVEIKEWGIINLLEEVTKKCHGFIDSKNNRSECVKKCTHYYQNGGNTHYFCGLHKNQYVKINKEILELESIKTKDKCERHKNSGEQCNKKATYKININGESQKVCTNHTNLIKKKHDSNTIQKVIKTNANKAPTGPIIEKLIVQMDKRKHFLDVDYVLIENQPSLKNPKMKSIASSLYFWFLCEKVRYANDPKCKLKEVMYLSPSNKLKINDDNIQKEINALPKNKQYKYTKDMAVVKTKQLIKNNDKWTNFLSSNSKKDDLCDCYLQGLFFINNKYKFIKKNR